MCVVVSSVLLGACRGGNRLNVLAPDGAASFALWISTLSRGEASALPSHDPARIVGRMHRKREGNYLRFVSSSPFSGSSPFLSTFLSTFFSAAGRGSLPRCSPFGRGADCGPPAGRGSGGRATGAGAAGAPGCGIGATAAGGSGRARCCSGTGRWTGGAAIGAGAVGCLRSSALRCSGGACTGTGAIACGGRATGWCPCATSPTACFAQP